APYIFLFTAPPTPLISPLSLHDALPISELARKRPAWWLGAALACWLGSLQKVPMPFFIWLLIVLTRLRSRDERADLRKGSGWLRSEEHTSELQSPYDLVCRLLLEKKKKR